MIKIPLLIENSLMASGDREVGRPLFRDLPFGLRLTSIRATDE
ncbi:hypothetical protein PQR14_18380 [Paraburkholderia bryophila]|nr:hypothetical protein [Burkholderia sp. 9120]